MGARATSASRSRHSFSASSPIGHTSCALAYDGARRRSRMAGPQRPRWRNLIIVAFAACALAARAHAQDFRGSIAGVVSDQTGGALPGVTVTVTNAETGVARTLTTDEHGAFQALYLNSGTYTVAAELSGFKKVVRSGNQVRVGDALQLAITLETGAIAETIVVTADVPLLNTSTGVTG